jgi:hypothetical protein
MSDQELKYIELPSPPLGTENEASEGREDVIGKNGLWPDTELDLNTSANLSEGSATQDMTAGSLGGASQGALSQGFDTLPMTETLESYIRIDSPDDNISPGARPEVCVSRKY